MVTKMREMQMSGPHDGYSGCNGEVLDLQECAARRVLDGADEAQHSVALSKPEKILNCDYDQKQSARVITTSMETFFLARGRSATPR